MQTLLGWFFSPLFFGLAFFAPLFAQILVTMEIATPIEPLLIGLAVGGAWGLMAQLRGSWVWVRP